MKILDLERERERERMTRKDESFQNNTILPWCRRADFAKEADVLVGHDVITVCMYDDVVIYYMKSIKA